MFFIIKESHGPMPSWEILLSPNWETEFQPLGSQEAKELQCWGHMYMNPVRG